MEICDQNRRVPVLWISKLLQTCDCCVSPVLSLPFSFWMDLSDVDILSIFWHCILKWGIYFTYREKKATWYGGMGISVLENLMVICLAPLRNEEYSMCWRKDKMDIWKSRILSCGRYSPVLFPLPGNSFKVTISVKLVPNNWVVADGL